MFIASSLHLKICTCTLFLFNLHLDAKAASLGLTLRPLSKPGFQSLHLSLQNPGNAAPEELMSL